MARPSRNLSHVLAEVYDAAVQPTHWPQALEAIATFCGVDSSILYLEDHDRHVASFMHLYNVREDVVEPYTTYYVFREPGYSYRLDKPAGTVTASNQLVADADHERSEYYTDFLRKTGLFYTAGVTLAKDGGFIGALGIQRPKNQGAFEPRDLARLHLLYPHLQRAYRLMRAFGHQREQERVFSAMLDRVPHAVLLLDTMGCVTHCNARAEALLGDQDGLRLESRRLAADNLKAQARLEEAVLQAVRMGRALGGSGGELTPHGATLPPALAVPRASGAPPYGVLATPLRVPAVFARLAPPGAVAAVFVSDPGVPPVVVPEWLETLFGLTAAEARIAVALARGLTPRDIALHHEASLHTVRTQLRAVHEKLGTRRQAEVVQRVLSSPAVLGDPDEGRG